MNYCQRISFNNPGCVLIMIDQAASMGELSFSNFLRTPLTGGLTSRAEGAATAANEVIRELGITCQSGTQTKDWFMVSVLGYGGGGVRPICSGMISTLMQQPQRWERVRTAYTDHTGNLTYVGDAQPVWVEPAAFGRNSMAEAFAQVRNLISSRWLPLHSDSFPPIVINLTDGRIEDADAVHAEASRLMELKTSDGSVLLFNCCIARQPTPEVVFPYSVEEIPGEEAGFLFQISSALPPALFYQASLFGSQLRPGARGFLLEHSPTILCRLLSLGSSPLWTPQNG